MWALYQQLCTQWRVSMAGLLGLDLGVFLPVIHDQGWDLDVALDLLGAIEGELLTKREEEPG